MRKEHKESQKEIIVIGFVKEIEDNRRNCSIGIASGNNIYRVKLDEEGKNLLYEVGNKVEATGVITRTKDGTCRIHITGYMVYEMDEDGLEELSIERDLC